MKKIFSLVFSFIFFISIFAFTYFYPLTSPSVSAWQQHTPKNINNSISRNSLLEYHSNDTDLSFHAKNQIAKIVLDKLEYTHWNDLIEYIDTSIYQEKILPSTTSQLIIVLNLSKDLAVIAIFDKINGEYIFYSKIENLVPISNIFFYTYPSKDYKFMAIKQVLDEKLGAFVFEEFIEIFFYLDDSFVSV